MPGYFNNASRDADDTMAQIVRLRDQVERLMREKVAQVVDDTTDRVEAAANDAADMVRERADALASGVRERPLVAVLLAAAIGYLIGRVAR